MATTDADPLVAGGRQLERLALGAVAVNLLLWIVALGVAVATGEHAGELGVLGWLSGLQLLAVAATAWCNYRIARRRIWLAFAVGFVWLAIDERFELHEWARDTLFVPHGIATGVGWLEPGDVGLLIYAALGAIATIWLIPDLRDARAAAGLFAGALGLAVVTSVLDSSRAAPPGLADVADGALLDVLQLAAQLLFLLSFVVLARQRLRQRVDAGDRTEGLRLLRVTRDDVRRFALALIAIDLLLPIGFAVRAALTDDVFYEMFWGERDPISWFSSVQLLIVALVAYAVYQTSRSESAGAGRPRDLVWVVFALGFTFLALDERFELHELLRERLFAPAGVSTGVPGLRVGDVALFLYLAVGLVFAWLLWRELRAHPPAPALFVAALVLSALIVVEDALDPAVRDRLPLPGFWDSAFEEVGEIWAQLAFALAFLVVLWRRLDAALAARDAVSPAPRP